MFYGWWVVIAVLAILTISSGLGFYNLPVFLKALVAERGLSVSVVSMATSFFFLTTGVFGIVVARLIVRFDPRYTLCAGAVTMALALILIGRIETIWDLFLAYGLFGLGFTSFSFVPGTTLVARWFAEKRSLALAFATSGLSLGGILLTPISAFWIQKYGLEKTTMWLAGITISISIPIIFLLIRPDPQSMGLTVDGVPKEKGGREAQTGGISYKQASRSRFYIFCTIAFFFALMTQVGAISHQYKLIADRVDLETAAYGVSVLAFASMAGRLLGGWVMGQMSIRVFALIILAWQGISFVVIANVHTASGLIFATALFGASVGNILMLLPLLMADAYGIKDYAKIYATSQMYSTIGVAIGPSIIGFMYSALGNYVWAYNMLFIGIIIAIFSFLLAGKIPSHDNKSR